MADTLTQCTTCGGWFWWRMKGTAWSCWCCDPPPFPWSPKDIEIINVAEGRLTMADAGGLWGS
jgi:hypothetical protein